MACLLNLSCFIFYYQYQFEVLNLPKIRTSQAQILDINLFKKLSTILDKDHQIPSRPTLTIGTNNSKLQFNLVISMKLMISVYGVDMAGYLFKFTTNNLYELFLKQFNDWIRPSTSLCPILANDHYINTVTSLLWFSMFFIPSMAYISKLLHDRYISPNRSPLPICYPNPSSIPTVLTSYLQSAFLFVTAPGTISAKLVSTFRIASYAVPDIFVIAALQSVMLAQRLLRQMDFVRRMQFSSLGSNAQIWKFFTLLSAAYLAIANTYIPICAPTCTKPKSSATNFFINQISSP